MQRINERLAGAIPLQAAVLLCCNHNDLVAAMHCDMLRCWRRPKSEPLLRVVPTEN